MKGLESPENPFTIDCKIAFPGIDLDLTADDECEEMEQECDHGNVEYKWKLIGKTPERIKHLVTQMNYRLTEGQGECVYRLGVLDNGHPKGLADAELAESIMTIKRMGEELKCDVVVLRVAKGRSGKIAEVLVRRLSEADVQDVRLCMLGDVGSGKSTLVGVLISGNLDDGKGLARMNVFRHRHEVESGRSSSISRQLLGFDEKGNVTNSSANMTGDWQEIVQDSSKVLTFLDLAGSESYLKTTMFGLVGQSPDYALVAVSALDGLPKMMKEHLGLCLALHIPLFIVLTKADEAPQDRVQATLQALTDMLDKLGLDKKVVVIGNNAQSARSSSSSSSLAPSTVPSSSPSSPPPGPPPLTRQSTSTRGYSQRELLDYARNMKQHVPIFLTSSVTGQGLDAFRSFLHFLPKSKDWSKFAEQPAELSIDDRFHVDGVGTVVAGMVVRGHISSGDRLLLGPDEHGGFRPVTVKSVHVKKTPVKRAVAGQAACFALNRVKKDSVRKGMVLLDPSLEPRACSGFEASIYVLHHPTGIKDNFQAVVHIGTITQSCTIQLLGQDVVRNERATVRFTFNCRPEYIKPKSKLIFRDGQARGVGKVTKLEVMDPRHPFEPLPVKVLQRKKSKRSKSVSPVSSVILQPPPQSAPSSFSCPSTPMQSGLAVDSLLLDMLNAEDTSPPRPNEPRHD